MPFIRSASAFYEFHKAVSVATEAELRRLRVMLSSRDPHHDAKARMIDKRIAMRHGYIRKDGVFCHYTGA